MVGLLDRIMRKFFVIFSFSLFVSSFDGLFVFGDLKGVRGDDEGRMG